MKKRIYNLAMLLATAIVGVVSGNAENSPYISKIYDFVPAPGQFVNDVPEYEEGDTKDVMLEKVAENLCGEARPGMISLGGYGGYVVFGFDHEVVNVSGSYDFKIYGNAFKANNASSGGSCEPGIVMVSKDENGNGIADDPWYELAGSEYNKSTTKKNYKITYYRPDENKVKDPDPNNSAITDRTYVKWTTNYSDETSGYVMKNSFHSQSYWPQWLSDEKLEFEGTKLADNATNQGTGGSAYYVLSFLDWGYVDNISNDQCPGFDIDWAVDADGNPVKLGSIDFIKVYTALNQYCGWIGETSTEVCGAEDLHPDAINSVVSAESEIDNVELIRMGSDVIVRSRYDNIGVSVYNMSGQKILETEISSGDNLLQLADYPAGVYLINVNGIVKKFYKY